MSTAPTVARQPQPRVAMEREQHRIVRAFFDDCGSPSLECSCGVSVSDRLSWDDLADRYLQQHCRLSGSTGKC